MRNSLSILSAVAGLLIATAGGTADRLIGVQSARVMSQSMLASII